MNKKARLTPYGEKRMEALKCDPSYDGEIACILSSLNVASNMIREAQKELRALGKKREAMRRASHEPKDPG